MNHQVPQAPDPRPAPTNGTLQGALLPLLQKTPHLPVTPSACCVPKYRGRRDAGQGPQPPASVSGRGPEDPSPRGPPNAAPVRTPSNALKGKPRVCTRPNPRRGTPAGLPRPCRAPAAPAAAERREEGDVLFQHRVHHGRRRGGGARVRGGDATGSPRCRDPLGSPGPRPLQPRSCSDSGGAAGIQTAASAIFPGASSYGNEAWSPRRAR